jgi:hypothetical protein
MGPSTRLTAAELAAAESDLESAEVLLAVLGILQPQVKRPEAEVEGVEATGEELVEAWRTLVLAMTAITCKSRR